MKDRARLFVLSHFNMAMGAENLAEAYVFRARERLQRVQGFVEILLWRAYGDSPEAMLLFEYVNEEAANAGLAAMSEGHMALVEQGLSLMPPMNIVFEAMVHDGHLFTQTGPQSTLSYALRGGSIGQFQSLESDLRMVLASLREFDGYSGCYAGPRVSLDEEWVSIVLWDSFAAFEKSLPPQSQYEVKAYHRLA